MADPLFTLGDAVAGADWQAIEDAFFDWIAAATGLADEQIVWTKQGVLRPATALVSLQLVSVQVHGVDAHAHTYDADADLNAELTHVVVGPRIGILRVQHYGGDATGNASSL